MLFRQAGIGLDRAAELDDQGIAAPIPSGGDFNTHPTFGHLVVL
jgi:hypothetical protein